MRRALGFLHSAPAHHTVLLSVTETLRTRGPHVYGDGDPLFGVAAGRDGAVCGAFVWTPPHRLSLSPLDGPATGALVDALAAAGRELPGAVGDVTTVEAFVAAWARRTGVVATPGLRQRLYRLGDLTPPSPASAGRARVAGAGDRELLVRWYHGFLEAVGEPALMDGGEWADARIEYGGVTLWEAPDGTPVSMAGTTRRSAGQVRVAPVYTPAAERGRGYGGAVTAEVSRAARDGGADEVVLFTDLANPTSNALYQRIGYRPVGDCVQYGFVAGPGGGAAVTATATP